MLLLRRAGVCVLSHTSQLFKSGEINQPTPLKRQTSWKRSCSRPDWETCFGGLLSQHHIQNHTSEVFIKTQETQKHTHSQNTNIIPGKYAICPCVLYAIWFRFVRHMICLFPVCWLLKALNSYAIFFPSCTAYDFGLLSVCFYFDFQLVRHMIRFVRHTFL